MKHFLGLLVLCCWAGAGWAAHAQDTTKETVLRWVETFRSATPEFQAGETLKLGDLENVHPFLPPGYVEEYNFPDVEFAITQTGDYPPHPAYHAATEKFAGQTRLATDGALENYIAGQPFPNASLDTQDPESGLKAAWNFNFRWQHWWLPSISRVCSTSISSRKDGAKMRKKGCSFTLLESLLTRAFGNSTRRPAWVPEERRSHESSRHRSDRATAGGKRGPHPRTGAGGNSRQNPSQRGV